MSNFSSDKLLDALDELACYGQKVERVVADRPTVHKLFHAVTTKRGPNYKDPSDKMEILTLRTSRGDTMFVIDDMIRSPLVCFEPPLRCELVTLTIENPERELYRQLSYLSGSPVVTSWPEEFS